MLDFPLFQTPENIYVSGFSFSFLEPKIRERTFNDSFSFIPPPIFFATKMEDWGFMFVHFMAICAYVVLISYL